MTWVDTDSWWVVGAISNSSNLGCESHVLGCESHVPANINRDPICGMARSPGGRVPWYDTTPQSVSDEALFLAACHCPAISGSKFTRPVLPALRSCCSCLQPTRKQVAGHYFDSGTPVSPTTSLASRYQTVGRSAFISDLDAKWLSRGGTLVQSVEDLGQRSSYRTGAQVWNRHR